jgi:predicted ATPase
MSVQTEVHKCAKHGEVKTFRWGRWRCAICERERNRARDRTEKRKEWRRDYQFLNSFRRNGQAQVRYHAKKERQLIAEGKFGEPAQYSDFSIFYT